MTGTKWIDQADLVSLLHSGDLGFGRCDCHAASGTVGTQQSLSETRSKQGSCVILVDLLMKPHSWKAHFNTFQAFQLASAEINRHHQRWKSPGRYMPCICGGEDDAICGGVFIEDLHCINGKGTATMAVVSKSLKLLLKSCCLPAEWAACRFVSSLDLIGVLWSHGRVTIWQNLGQAFTVVSGSFCLSWSSQHCWFWLGRDHRWFEMIRDDHRWTVHDSSCQFWRCQLEVWLHAHACGCAARNSHLDDLECSSNLSSFRAKMPYAAYMLPSFWRSALVLQLVEIRCPVKHLSARSCWFSA